jgi:hypothetical protein
MICTEKFRSKKELIYVVRRLDGKMLPCYSISLSEEHSDVLKLIPAVYYVDSDMTLRGVERREEDSDKYAELIPFDQILDITLVLTEVC